MVVSPLDLTEMKVEMAVTLTKIRWGMWSKDQVNLTSPEIVRQEAEEPEEEKVEREDLEAEMRDVVSSCGRKIDMGRLRATDMSNNRSVYMPRPAGPKTEAELSTRQGMWLKSFTDFMETRCDKTGVQNDTNISPSEQIALKSLGRKVAEKKIVIMEADKGKMLVVVDTEVYQQMSEDHVDPADSIDPAQLRQSERLLSAQAKALVNTLGAGRLQSAKNFARCYDNVALAAEDAATLKLLPKTHKPLKPQGYPQSRPVVAAASGMSSRAGDLVSEFLDPLVYLTVPRFEDRSTEEVISQLEEAQTKIRDDKETQAMVASLDVKALYPSLHQEESAAIVGRFVEESDVDLMGIDWDLAQLIVASNWDQDRIKKEGMSGFIPRRTRKKGNRPGPMNTEITAKRWRDPRSEDHDREESDVHVSSVPGLGADKKPAVGRVPLFPIFTALRRTRSEVRERLQRDPVDPGPVERDPELTVEPSLATATPTFSEPGPRHSRSKSVGRAALSSPGSGDPGEERFSQPKPALRRCFSSPGSGDPGEEKFSQSKPALRRCVSSPGSGDPGEERFSQQTTTRSGGGVALSSPGSGDPGEEVFSQQSLRSAGGGALSSPGSGDPGEEVFSQTQQHHSVQPPTTTTTTTTSSGQTTGLKKLTYKWTTPKPLTDKQKRRVIGCVIQIVVLAIFKNHCYQFRGRLYRQSKGGPIGLRLTSIVARIVMDSWAAKVLFKLDLAGANIYAFMKYVDDVNVVLTTMRKGLRWVGDSLVWTEEAETEDELTNHSAEKLTMTRVREAAESVFPWLQFTVDLPEDHENGAVPMLDLQVWLQPMDDRPGDQTERDTEEPQQEPRIRPSTQALCWAFYEKPSASTMVLRASSAYNWRSKLVTMNMEVFRRLRNTSRQLAPSSRAKILGDFVSKLRASGYLQSTVRGMLLSGTKFYYRKLRMALEGGPRLNVRTDTDLVGRRRAKAGASKDWYARRRGGQDEVLKKTDPRRQVDSREAPPRTGRGQPGVPGVQTQLRDAQPHQQPDEPDSQAQPAQEVTAILLVPYTLGSVLRDNIQRKDKEFVALVGGGKSVRVVEKGGDKLINTLGRNDPWAGDRSCTDQDCIPCASRRWVREEKKLAKSRGETLPDILLTNSSNQCRREGCNYTLQCLGCLDLGNQALYRGESARSCRQRQKEHSQDLKNGVVTSPLVIHTVEVHGGLTPKFLVLLDTVEPKAMYRLIRESVLIQGVDQASHYNLNRCQEWGSKSVLPEVQVTGGSRWSMEVMPEENPNPQWTVETKRKIEMGEVKRVVLWTSAKRQRLDSEAGAQQPADPPTGDVDVDVDQWMSPSTMEGLATQGQ